MKLDFGRKEKKRQKSETMKNEQIITQELAAN